MKTQDPEECSDNGGSSSKINLSDCRPKREQRLPANVGTNPPGEDPFKNYLIDDWHILDTVDQRSECPKCKKSRKYFCYTCYVPVTPLAGKIPCLKGLRSKIICMNLYQLPIKIDVIKHIKEIDGKSTAAHAAVLAPEDVSIYTYPCIPDYDQMAGKVILIYPSKSATSLHNFLSQIKTEQDEKSAQHESKRARTTMSNLLIERAVFIDSTWNQSRGIAKDSRLKGLPCVVLQQRLSQFWRHQEGSPRWYLATVEAIHQLLEELSNHVTVGNPAVLPQVSSSDLALKAEGGICGKETGVPTLRPSDQDQSGETSLAGRAKASKERRPQDFDNLLFFFRFMYDKIHHLYEPESLRAYKRPLT